MEGKLHKWWPLVKAELTPRKDLILLKIILGLQLFGIACASSYIVLYMQQLGLSYKELAIIAACQPITSAIGPFVSGIVADKTGHYKAVIILNIVLTSVILISLLYVPVRTSTTMNFNCNTDGHYITWHNCNICNQHNSNTSINLHIQVTINGTVLSREDGERCTYVWNELKYSDVVYQKLTCPNNNNSNDCAVNCDITTQATCSEPTHQANNPATFWGFLVLRLLWILFMTSYYFLMDATTLAMIKERGGDFGKQRVLAIITSSIAPPITGVIIDWYSIDLGYSDYRPALVMAAAVQLMSAVFVPCLHFNVERTENKMLSDLKQLVTKKEVDALLILAFILGANWGFLATYLFPLLKSLQAQNYIMGLSVLVANISAVPLLFLADKIIDNFGYHTIFITAIFVYAVKEFITTLFTNPWGVVALEILKALSSNLPWIAMIRLCPVLAPKGLIATMSGIVGPMHYTFGSSMGSFLGGNIASSLSLVDAFRIFSYMNIGFGTIYIILYFGYIKHHQSPGTKQVEEVAPMINPTITVTAADTAVTAIDTTVTAADTTVTAVDTTVRAADTTVMAVDTTVTAADTTVTAADNAVTVADTAVTAADTAVTAADTTITAADTTITAADTTVTTVADKDEFGLATLSSPEF